MLHFFDFILGFTANAVISASSREIQRASVSRGMSRTGREIFAKAEFQNPGGSIKDRAALAIIEAAESSGALRPGGVIGEDTADASRLPICDHNPNCTFMLI